jgi:hypothetical protein
MDYMLMFPSTNHGNDCVFVVDDQFSRMEILAPCKKSIIDKDTTNILFEHVKVHFGLPWTIFSNMDSRFLITF